MKMKKHTIFTMKFRMIQNEHWCDGGSIKDWAKQNNHQLIYTKLYEYEAVPNEIDADGLIVLGGPQNPHTTVEECPFYDASKIRALIKKYIDANKIVIGFCLGSQLIGEALGAEFSHSPYQEVGYVKGVFTSEGRKDPLFSSFPDEMEIGEWHNDMPGLTKDTVIIMKSEGCPRQIVRYSKYVYGFQTHLEFDRTSYLNGIKESSESLELNGPYIKTKEDILAFDPSKMNALLSSFLNKLVDLYLE